MLAQNTVLDQKPYNPAIVSMMPAPGFPSKSMRLEQPVGVVNLLELSKVSMYKTINNKFGVFLVNWCTINFSTECPAMNGFQYSNTRGTKDIGYIQISHQDSAVNCTIDCVHLASGHFHAVYFANN